MIGRRLGAQAPFGRAMKHAQIKSRPKRCNSLIQHSPFRVRLGVCRPLHFDALSCPLESVRLHSPPSGLRSDISPNQYVFVPNPIHVCEPIALGFLRLNMNIRIHRTSLCPWPIAEGWFLRTCPLESVRLHSPPTRLSNAHRKA